MKDAQNLHLKLQEHIDCFATTDPLSEMSAMDDAADPGEEAIKWLALAALHGINQNAEKITISRSSDGNVKVVAHYREAELPQPGAALADHIIAAVRGITHIEGDQGKTALALGIRDDSMELRIKLKHKKDRTQVVLKFPA